MSPDIDARLRDYAHRWRAVQSDPHVYPGPSPATRGQSRPARLTAVAAVAASVAAVAVLAGGLVVMIRSQRGPAPAAPPGSAHVLAGEHVPWNPTTVRPDTSAIPDLTKVGAPAGLRRCSNADLHLESAHTVPAADGWLTTTFVLASVAATSCSVPNGPVDVQLVSADGTVLPLGGSFGRQTVLPSLPVVFPSALLVQPRQLISGTALWAVYAGPGPRPARLVIDISGVAPVGSDAPSVSLAGVTIPPFRGAPPQGSSSWRATGYATIDRVISPGTLASLTATVSAPATVAVGDVLRYSVTLTNPTPAAVPLSPCPPFAQRVDVIPIKFATTVGFRGTLNCAAAPNTIAPGASLTFDVQLDTTGEIAGPGWLSWQLVDGSTAVVSSRTMLTVRP